MYTFYYIFTRKMCKRCMTHGCTHYATNLNMLTLLKSLPFCVERWNVRSNWLLSLINKYVKIFTCRSRIFMNEIANKQASYDIMPIIMNVGTKLTASIYIFECYCELLSSNWHWLTGSSCRSGDEFSTKQEWMKGESIIHLHKSNQKQLQGPSNQPHFC